MKPIAPLLHALTLLLALLSAQTSHAAPTLSQGYDAFEQGDVTTAIQIWTSLAEQGDTTAQVNLGQLYRQGRGVDQDDREAVKWYSMAAQQGSETAQFNLLIMQKEGRASEEDLALAFAGQGETPASTGAAQTGAVSTVQPGTAQTGAVSATQPGTTTTAGLPSGAPVAAGETGLATGEAQTALATTSVASKNQTTITPTPREDTQQPAPVAVATTGSAASGSAAPGSAAPGSAAPTSGTSMASGEAWLWQTPARHYLLQIVASSNRARVMEYVGRHLGDFQSQLHIAHTSNQGRDWFVLLMGPFATRDEATATLQRLPPATLKDKPWARSVQSIQKAVAGRDQG